MTDSVLERLREIGSCLVCRGSAPCDECAGVRTGIAAALRVIMRRGFCCELVEAGVDPCRMQTDDEDGWCLFCTMFMAANALEKGEGDG